VFDVVQSNGMSLCRDTVSVCILYVFRICYVGSVRHRVVQKVTSTKQI